MEQSLPHLSPRLALAASFVRPGSRVADIGTDHAYLPVWLVRTGVCPRAFASDVREGPLAAARRTALRFGAQDRVDFTLADGLAGLAPGQAEDIVLAGMGGELIAELIARCAWLRNPAYRLILQPMTAQPELHAFLCENGFSIEREEVASEKGGRKLYLVIAAVYGGGSRIPTPAYLYCGELEAGGQDAGAENARAYLLRQAEALCKRARGLRASREPDEAQAGRLEEIAGLVAERALRPNKEGIAAPKQEGL